MNKIIIELTEGDQTRLDRLSAALDRMAAAYEAMTQGTVLIDSPAAPAAEAPSAPAQAQQAHAPASDTPEPVKPAESSTAAPAATQYTKADVQGLVVQLCTQGKKAEVKAVVNEYAPNVSGIPADKYGEVVAKLKTLEG